MSTGIFAIATDLAILAAGRRPQWVEVAPSSEPPLSSGGTPTYDAITALVLCRLRATQAGRSITITIDTLDLAATYTLTIGGVAAAYDADAAGAASLADVLDGWEAEILSEGIGTVTQTDDGLVVVASTSADVGISLAADGTADVSGVVDAASAVVELWGRGREREDWTPANGGSLTCGHWGLVERVDCAGFDRLSLRYVGAGHADDAGVSLADPASLSVGPGRPEID